VADAARGLTSLPDARGLEAGAVQRRWCSMSELSHELAQGPVAGSALPRRVLAEVAGGIRSRAQPDQVAATIQAALAAAPAGPGPDPHPARHCLSP
jgi:hypothetical protein